MRDTRVNLKKTFPGRKKALTLCMTLVLHVNAVLAQEESQNLEFDESLFLGTKFASGLDQLNKENSVTAGSYDAVDVLVNNRPLKRTTIKFVKNADSSEVYPCLSDEFLTAAGIELTNKNNIETQKSPTAEEESIHSDSEASSTEQ